jgi:hypothetical protein
VDTNIVRGCFNPLDLPVSEKDDLSLRANHQATPVSADAAQK